VKKVKLAVSKLNEALSIIDKLFGSAALYRFGDGIKGNHPALSTGSIKLNNALGIGGYAIGRIVEIYGPESSGKTTLALHAIAEAQKLGGLCAFIDAEHALDPSYASKVGVNMADLLFSQPDYGEQALEILKILLESRTLKVIVIDSVAALTPKSEIDGDMGDSQMGSQARLMSQAMRKITALVNKSGTVVIFINQTRMKIGVMFGNPETTTGGNALKFYAAQRLEVRRVSSNKGKNDEILSNKTKVKVVKSKVAPPFKVAEFDIRFGVGIDRVGELIDIGIESGAIKKTGAWFIIGKDIRFNGREQLHKAISEKPKYLNYLYKKITGEEYGTDV
jgi:recombination protein RecA